MATIRRAGFGSVFEVENETVGIGTTGTATNTLQVLGETRASDAKIIGLSTLTTYQGFVDKEARFTTGQIDNQSQSGSTSGEIVIDGDVTVSSATTTPLTGEPNAPFALLCVSKSPKSIALPIVIMFTNSIMF